MYNIFIMKGGKRSNPSSVGRYSVHRLQPNNANRIRDALERMNEHERFDVYRQVKEGEDAENIELFESLYGELYPEEFEKAKATVYSMPSWTQLTQYDLGKSINEVLSSKGGKTRRNRNRKRRGRGRRSLKHYSKRR